MTKTKGPKSFETSLIDPIGDIIPGLENLQEIAPKPQRKKYIKKVASRATAKEKQPAMFIDFPEKTETPKNPPTKVTLIIQLMSVLNALVPNRELLWSIGKLIKVFISVAFTLSAIYASCIIYMNIFEWLITLMKKFLKICLKAIQAYLPEILQFDIIRKNLSFLIGVEVEPPINTYKYIPNFVYDM